MLGGGGAQGGGMMVRCSPTAATNALVSPPLGWPGRSPGSAGAGL